MNFTIGANDYSFSPLLIIAIVAWSLFWKGWALWRAAREDQKAWFLLLLLVNTAGILEIFYIFVFSKHHSSTPKADS